MAKNQAVAKQEPARPIDLFKASLDKAAPTIMKMLPRHVSREKFQAMVVTTVAYNEKLLECVPSSLLRATAEAAELGLSLNPSLKEADILPVWDYRVKGLVAQMRPRYMGLMKLARQSGEITDIYAHAVREGDEFDYAYGLDKKLHHKPGAKRGDLTHVYCVWQTRDGIKSFEVLDKERVLKSRDRSEGWKAFAENKIKSTPWKNDEEEMWRKTAVKLSSKYMPSSSENFSRAVDLDNRRDAGEPVTVDNATGEIVPDPEAIDITEPSPDTRAPEAQKQVKSLEAKIAASTGATVPQAAPDVVGSTATMPPIPESMRRTPAEDYDAWAAKAVAEIATLSVAECTSWRKKNAVMLQKVEFVAPDAFALVQKALDG
jgi:recombination protein RecT